ncbi:MAG: FHA domain-containing protein [Terracoccus sp.]
MSAVCPNGHPTESEDYCDTCGSPVDATSAPGAAGATGAAGAAGASSLDLDPAPSESSAPSPPAAPVAPSGVTCPNCETENPDGALFCEACGYDFTTGAMPRDPGAPSTVDDPTEPHGFEAVPAPSGAAPIAPPVAFEWLAEVWVDPDWYQTQQAQDPCPSPGLPVIVPLRHRSILLGRVSSSRNTNPEIDLSSDPGVSRRHAQLTTDGTRWFVEDLGSSNGTYVGEAAAALPVRGIAVGPRTELADDDRLYVGAWTRVVVRRATPDEVDAFA